MDRRLEACEENQEYDWDQMTNADVRLGAIQGLSCGNDECGVKI